MRRFTALEDGRVEEFFIVPRHGNAYALPELGTAWTVQLGGRLPGRYDLDRGIRDVTSDIARAENFELTMHVQYVDPDTPGGTAYIEAYARLPVVVRATAFVRIGELGMPSGIASLLLHNEMDPGHVKQLAGGDNSPVGFVRLTP